MKYALIICCSIICCSSFQTKLPGKPGLSLNAFISKREGSNLAVQVTLTNNSADTIRYVTWDCSWQESYTIDNDKWKIYVEYCFKNGHKTVAIPPYKTETSTLELTRVYGYRKSGNADFKIGFHCIPPPETLIDLTVKPDKQKITGYTIWSNTVSANYFSKQ